MRSIQNEKNITDDSGVWFRMCTNENEVKQLGYQKFNQKFLTNGGVCVYFSNVFTESGKGKLPIIKNKLRKVLVDFGLVQTCLEISQELNFIRVWYQDPKAKEFKGTLLQRYNQTKESQAIETSINLESNMCSPPKVERGIKTYPGLTKLIYQEFIEEPKVSSMIDVSPYNEIESIIKQGNLAASVPLESILIEGVD